VRSIRTIIFLCCITRVDALADSSQQLAIGESAQECRVSQAQKSCDEKSGLKKTAKHLASFLVLCMQFQFKNDLPGYQTSAVLNYRSL
jgi:hypothetical protein